MDVNFRGTLFMQYIALEMKNKCAVCFKIRPWQTRKWIVFLPLENVTTKLTGIGHSIELLNIYLGFGFSFPYCFTIFFFFCKSVFPQSN